MNTARVFKTTLGYLWRLPLCALAYVGGAAAGGALIAALGLPLPQLPEQADERNMSLCLTIGSLVLALGLAPLARRIHGPYWVRWLTLAGLCYVCLGVNTPIEAAIFTHLGGMTSIPVFSIVPCLLLAAVMTLLFRPADKGGPFLVNVKQFFAGRSAGEWAWRIGAAICSFPVIYWMFGLMIAPIVRPYYEQGQFGLALPTAGVIILIQLLRSVLFLVAALPILIAEAGSRRHLVLALGLAFYVLVGLFGLIQTYWLAPTLLVLHNLEIFADSMVYALALTLLLVRGGEAKADELFARFPLCPEQAAVEK
ncbi:MAG: hypothetical protein MUC88_13105 [Planctomycetes bacterium]|jgi:hypothetical protein|nr:hypothetical protein [Planctomycetota bacterium]